MKPSNINDRTLAQPSKLTMHEDSRVISKVRPKIRIIHIVAPKIITTDAENFRELVQRLTGKQAEREGRTKKWNSVSNEVTRRKNNTESLSVPFVQTTNRVKKENEEMYGLDNPNSFLSFFGEVDGFIQEMNEFPLLPFRSSSQYSMLVENCLTD